MSDISNDDMLAFHLATFEEDAIMEEPVGSNQKLVFLEFVYEEEQDLLQGLSQSNSDLLTSSVLVQIMNPALVEVPILCWA